MAHLGNDFPKENARRCGRGLEDDFTEWGVELTILLHRNGLGKLQ